MDFAAYNAVSYTAPLFYKLSSSHIKVVNKVTNKWLSVLIFFTIFFFLNLG
jgi:hypothetical protein